jgi:hypothetical protein
MTPPDTPLIPNSPISFEVKRDLKKEARLKATMAVTISFIEDILDAEILEYNKEKTK